MYINILLKHFKVKYHTFDCNLQHIFEILGANLQNLPLSVPQGTINTVTGHPIVIIPSVLKIFTFRFVSSAGFLGYFVHYFLLFCSAIQAVGQISSPLTPFYGPCMAYTYYLGVPHDHILYLITYGFWFQNFVNRKQLSAVSWTKKFNHLG